MSLTIANLCKRFGDKILFSDFSLNLPDCGLYILRGSSGVGKTTLLRIIAGLDTSYSGSVVGGGYKNVSFAFQEYRLFPELTAKENVLVASFDNADETDETKTQELLLNFGLTEADIKLFPHELSGGMRQRVSLARAILKNTPILLLDEPTKELDPEIANTVRERILFESQQRLVIMVSHLEDEESFGAYSEIEL